MDYELVRDSISIIHRHPCIESQNLGKDQTLAALAAVAALHSGLMSNLIKKSWTDSTSNSSPSEDVKII